MKEINYIVEAVLFASDKPLAAQEIREAFEEAVSIEDVKSSLEALRQEYAASNRGFILKEIAGGYQFMTHSDLAPYLKRFYKSREKKKLSQAGLETLAIIAYRQPVTRADIEIVRGVNSDGALRTLLERNMVKMVGKKDVPGHPMMYGTTKEFLDHFGINSLQELPALTEFSEKDIPAHLLPPEMRPVNMADNLNGVSEDSSQRTGDR